MNATTKIISDQIRMLQDLRKLSLKPRFMDAVKLLVHQEPNGNGAIHPHPNAELRGPIWDTGITKAVVAALPRMHGDFTYSDVLKALEQDSYRMQAASARDSVGRVLRNLAKRGLIRQVRKGSGGSTTVYRRVE